MQFQILRNLVLYFLKSLLHKQPATFANWIVISLCSISPYLHLLSSVDIREDHPLFQSAYLWMRENWARIYYNRLSLASIQSLGPNATSDSRQQHLTHYVPAGTTRPFIENGTVYWINQSTDRDSVIITISTLGSHDAITKMLDTFDRTTKLVTAGGVKLMFPDMNMLRLPWWDPWKCVGWIKPATLEELALEHELRSKITRKVGSFLEVGKGQLGILLHGPPGTGKSSLAKAIALEFRLPLYQMSLKTQEGDALYKLSTKISQQSLVLFEDIDRVKFDDDNGSRQDHSGKVDLQSLLNVMDGAAAPQSALIIMTANDIEKLPPVLIRPGRIDMRIRMGLATSDQIQDIFLSMFKSHDHPNLAERAAQYREIVPPGRFSPAEIENFLQEDGRTPDTAVKDAEDWVNADTSSRDEGE